MNRHRWAWPLTPVGAPAWEPTPVGMATDTGRREPWELTPGNAHLMSLALARARVSPEWRPAARNLDLTARTYLDARTASLDAHPSTQNAIWKDHLCHIPIAKEPARRRRDAGETTRHDARRDTTHDATRRDTTADDYWCSRRPASGGTSSHARTQLRLASPARTHARTNETNTISRLDSPPNLRYIYIVCRYTI